MKNQRQRFPFSTKPTATHSLLLTAIVLLLAFGGMRLWQPASLAAKSASKDNQQCKHCSPPGDQIIYLPLIDLPEAQGSELVFNSRSPKEMEVTPTFYKLDGTAIVAKPVTVKSAEIRYVDLKQLIPGKYRNDQDWGGMSLAYTGVSREMWAQLRLLGINGGGNTDEFFTVPAELRASVQEAVWWMPQHSTAILALGNITDAATSAVVQFGSEPEQSVSLAPHATQIIRRAHDGKAGGEAVIIRTNGPIGSVVPTGLIAAADGSFNSTIRFYDTEHAKQPNLFANGARLAGVTPHLMLKNTTAAAIVATPKFIPLAGSTADGTLSLPSVTLAPHQVVELDLRSLSQAAQRRADLATVSVTVANSGAPGSLIGALYSQTPTTGVNYETPLRDSGPVRTMTGSYPWKISDDFTTIVYLTNISAGPAEFVGEINYDGGKHVVDPRKLAAGETAVFDLRKAVAAQQPNNEGQKLPDKVAQGQFKWAVRGVTGGKVILIGRAEMVSRAQRISTSYSCNDPCPPTYSGSITPTAPVVLVGSVDTMSVWETGYYGSGYSFGPYSVTGTWSSTNSSVAAISGNGHTATCTALAPGLATALAYIRTEERYVWDGLYCLDENSTYDVEGDAGVTVKPFITVDDDASNFWFFNNQYPTGYKTSKFLRAHPEGAVARTWAVTAGCSKATFGGNCQLNNETFNPVTLNSAARSTQANDISVTVTVNGVASDPVKLTVKAPHSLNNYAIQDLPDPTYGYISAHDYKIKDWQGNDQPNITVGRNEYWSTGLVSDYPGTNWTRPNPVGSTTSSGGFTDLISGSGGTITPANSSPCQPTRCNISVIHWGQEVYVGSSTPGLGVKVQSGTLQRYTDHARVLNRASPPNN